MQLSTRKLCHQGFKMVSLRSLVVGVALIAVPVMAVFTPTQVANGIDQLTGQTQALEPIANSISISTPR